MSVMEMTEFRAGAGGTPKVVRLDVRRLGKSVAKLSASIDPDDPQALQQLLVNVLRRRGEDRADIDLYELAVLDASGNDRPIFGSTS